MDGLWSAIWIGTGAVSDVQPSTWRVLPAPIYPGYCGIEELKSRLGITDTSDDYEIQMAIMAASQGINEACGQHFNRITETRTYQPHNIWILYTDPVVSVTALNVDRDGDGTFEESWVQNTDYQLYLGKDLYNTNALGIQRPYRVVQVIQTGRWFPFTWPYTHLDRIQIVGTWGWNSVPPPVSMAALALSADIFRRKDAPFGILGSSDFGVVRIRQDPFLQTLLSRFISPRHKVGV